jgi:hypothetical protein
MILVSVWPAILKRSAFSVWPAAQFRYGRPPSQVARGVPVNPFVVVLLLVFEVVGREK